MGSSLSHDRLVAILEAQNEIASADLDAREVMSLVVARARTLDGGDPVALVAQAEAALSRAKRAGSV